MKPDSIFAEEWWLEATAPGAWGRVQTSWDNVTVGELSFSIWRRWGLTFIGMPELTRTLSPRLNVPGRKPVSQRLNTLSIIAELVGRLPRHDRLEFALNPQCPSVQGFTHLNFPVMHTFTYRTTAGETADQALRNAHQKTRNIILKAEKSFAIERNTDLDRFLRLHAHEFSHDNKINYKVLARVFEAAATRDQAEIVYAVDEHARDVAAAILVGDRSTLYYWVATRDPTHATNAANALLIWEAMKIAEATNRQLDLDGYATPRQGRYLVKFGLDLVVRPYVSYGTNAWRCFNMLTSFTRPARDDRFYRV